MMTEKELGALTSAIYVARLSFSGGSVASDDKRLRASGLFDDWAPGSHKKDEIYCTHADEELGSEWEQVWRAQQDYDNAKNPDIVPGNSAWYTFNAPLHGTIQVGQAGCNRRDGAWCVEEYRSRLCEYRRHAH